ncbi:hypothetical protein JCM8547_008284 [Rhodosporidiobolus lusitaniae]
MHASKRRKLPASASPAHRPPLASTLLSLSKHKHRRARSSDSSSSNDDISDDHEKLGSSSSSSNNSSSDSSSGSDDERYGWRRRRRRRAATAKQHQLVLYGAIGIVLFVALVVAIYSYRSSSSPSSSTASSSGISSSSKSTTKASSLSKSTASKTATGTASAAGPTSTVTSSKDTAWFPVEKVRGVNLGSLFIFEPLGCADYDSEWPCIEALGLDTIQAKFETHWDTFYNATDFTEMARMGLNTVRVPLGCALPSSYDTLSRDGEYFAQGSMKYVKQVLGWAKAAGLYVILDLHGAPGSQTDGESFTGHKTDTAGFLSDANYQRAYDCLTNWTTMAHQDEDFSTVVAIHVVNEPQQDSSTNLTSVYYPGAQKAVRAAEEALGISCDDGSCLSIQYAQWIVDEDSHTREGYLKYLCTNTRSTDMAPVIVGEWSLSTIGGGELDVTSDGALEFFQQFAAAQIWAAEQGAGQVFWSWKTELGSSQWGYWDAVQAGFIPEDLSTLNTSVCDGYG